MKILLAGEGGQGAQSIAEILARTANTPDRFTTYIPNFGVEQRGGVSLAFLQISDQPIGYPKFEKADIIIAMGNRAIEPVKKFMSDQTFFIYDSSFIADDLVKTLQGQVKKYLALPAKEQARQIGSTKVANIIFLGALSYELQELPVEQIKKAMEGQFAAHPEFKDTNNQAFDLGLKYAKERPNQEFTGSKPKEIQKLFEDENKAWERFPEYCKGCSLCIISCLQKALTFGQDLNFLGTNLPQVDLNKCLACGNCQKICPDGAIKVTKKN